MINEWEEFCAYTGTVSYTASKKSDTTWLGRFTFATILEFEGMARILTILARGYAGTRKIVLPPSTAQLLRERKKTAPTEWIFPNPFDPEQPIAPGTAYNRLKALLKETGLPDIRFHDLRHTFATHALSSGVDAKTLAGILGHTKASFTLDTYTHTTGDMQKRAAEIVGGFLTDYLGEEMNPWQSRENTAAAPSV